jgi:hypothetical protein
VPQKPKVRVRHVVKKKPRHRKIHHRSPIAPKQERTLPPQRAVGARVAAGLPAAAVDRPARPDTHFLLLALLLFAVLLLAATSIPPRLIPSTRIAYAFQMRRAELVVGALGFVAAAIFGILLAGMS